MFSHVAQSRQLTGRALKVLREQAQRQFQIDVQTDVDTVQFGGLPLPRSKAPSRPGVVSLNDAWQRSDDFVLVSTTRSSMNEFRSHFDWSEVPESWRDVGRWRLSLPPAHAEYPELTVFDANY